MAYNEYYISCMKPKVILFPGCWQIVEVIVFLSRIKLNDKPRLVECPKYKVQNTLVSAVFNVKTNMGNTH